MIQVCLQQLSLLFKEALPFGLCSINWGLRKSLGEQQLKLVSITASSGTHCLTVEAHASHAFLETTNVITFIDEDMEVQHPDHSKPLYIAA